MTRIRSVHERVIEAPAEAVGALLDRLSAEDDPIFPTPAWDPMHFDRPLQVGAVGGHGPITYEVTEFEPGHRIRFDMTPPLDGYHEFTVEPLGQGHSRVRHVLELKYSSVGHLGWLAAVKPLHDTIVEEVFDNIERVTTSSLAHPIRHSPRVRLLGALMWAKPETSAIPDHARLIHTALDRPAYQDAYRMPLLPGLPRDPQAWTPILREAFPVIARDDREILLRVDTAGVTARASILVDDTHVWLCTVAAAESLRGRLYWGVVRLGHPFMARLMLRRTHRAFALAAPTAGERELSRRVDAGEMASAREQ
ncbi:SRPBCC family protein [Streptomyces sp. NPDC050418]|uniref:SRPBCC family protein n=1 Tax=Streptomyces sp. NPDC050418 TaxID=3365612 RepID=UPI00379E87EF